MSWEGSEAASGSSEVLVSGAKHRVPGRGWAILAGLCTGKCDLAIDLRRLVFQDSGLVLRGRRVQSYLCESGALYSSAKTDLASDPPALRPDASAGYSASRASCAS